jgi:hypothetical protein
VHKETWVGLAVKLWGSISCAGVTSKAKHSRGLENTNTSRIFFKKVSLANSRLFGGVFLWAKQATIFIGKEG